MKRHSCGCLSETAPLVEQDVEVGVEAEQDGNCGSGELRLPSEQASDAGDARRGTCAVPPPEVERRRRRAKFEEQLHPRRAASKKIGAHDASECPALEVLSLNRGIEHNPLALHSEAPPEFDVLNARVREAMLVKTADAKEFLAPDGSQTGPKRRGRSGGRVVDMMVKEIAEVRNKPAGMRIVVIRSEAALSSGGEGSANPPKGISMDYDVRIDEDEDVAAGSPCSRICVLLQGPSSWAHRSL